MFLISSFYNAVGESRILPQTVLNVSCMWDVLLADHLESFLASLRVICSESRGMLQGQDTCQVTDEEPRLNESAI